MHGTNYERFRTNGWLDIHISRKKEGTIDFDL